MLVAVRSRAGQPVQIRVDGTGRPVTGPRDPAEVDPGAVVLAVFLLMGGVMALAAAWTAVRRYTATLNDRAWTREWARVGPQWSGPGGTGGGTSGTWSTS
jgi:hypothetical protein